MGQRGIKGMSYQMRVKRVNEIYNEHAKDGLSNREILRRYVWPLFYISEKTFYNYLNIPFPDEKPKRKEDYPNLFEQKGP